MIFDELKPKKNVLLSEMNDLIVIQDKILQFLI